MKKEEGALFIHVGHMFLSSCLSIVDLASIFAPFVMLIALFFNNSWGVNVLYSFGLLFCVIGLGLRVKATRQLSRVAALYPVHQIYSITKTGPYRYIRHPWYVANFISAIGMGISIFLVSVCWSIGLVLFTLIIIILLIPIEERFLKDNFGDYITYSREIRAIVPAKT